MRDLELSEWFTDKDKGITYESQTGQDTLRAIAEAKDRRVMADAEWRNRQAMRRARA